MIRKILRPDDLIVVIFDDGPHPWQYRGLWKGSGEVEAIFREEDNLDTYIKVSEVDEITGQSFRFA